MTLKEFFDLLADNPFLLLAYFGMIPLSALISGFMGKNEGHLSPWKYLYSALVYLICVPGIFSITLNVYLFLFEKQSVFNADIYTQILPIFSMFVTLLLIKSNVALDRIPGFNKLSGLCMAIFATLIFMWIIDRTRIFVISVVPFYYVGILFLVLLLVFRFGIGRMFNAKPK